MHLGKVLAHCLLVLSRQPGICQERTVGGNDPTQIHSPVPGRKRALLRDREIPHGLRDPKPCPTCQRPGVEVIVFAQPHGLVIGDGVLLQECPAHHRFQETKFTTGAPAAMDVAQYEILEIEAIGVECLFGNQPGSGAVQCAFGDPPEVISHEIPVRGVVGPCDGQKPCNTPGLHHIIRIQKGNPGRLRDRDPPVARSGRPLVSALAQHRQQTPPIIGSARHVCCIIRRAVIDDDNLTRDRLRQCRGHGALDSCSRTPGRDDHGHARHAHI